MASPNISVQWLKSMTDREIDEVVRFHTKAYEGDPSLRMLVGGDWSLSGELGRAMVLATLLEGEVYIARESQQRDRIVALGLWYRPGTALFGTEEQRAKSGFNDFFGKLTPEFQQWYKSTYPDTCELELEKLFPGTESSKKWWCSNLVVDPEFHGRGYGKAIVEAVEQKAKEKGEFIALATALPLNVKKYHSMAFRERGTFKLDSPLDEPIIVHVLARD
ncbi:hypothetical protein PM082_018739 [Marasmius tenuissimus]|nr:hypothetical protein PM082_018739 [Marasmius tenuissimus]